MITDVLFRRYPQRWIYSGDVPQQLALLVRQAALILLDDIASKMPNRARLFEVPEQRLARELGVMALGQAVTPEQRAMNYLGEQHDIWNNAHGDPDTFFKLRLSLIELLFREAEAILVEYAPKKDVAAWWALVKRRISPGKNAVETALAATMGGIAELNDRFRDADFPFEYHNGLIQRVDDPVIAAQIEQPFWALIAEPKFSNVDADMKEAIDRRDTGKPDAAFHALKALESTLKILSEELGRTRGTEKGAADFVDNLVSSKHGRFVEVWEADILKAIFRDLRNPLGHGAGTSSPLSLTDLQTTWVIEHAMSWIKSLVLRKS